MNFLSQQLRPFAMLLSYEPMPKKDFMIMAHRCAKSTERNLVSLLEMTQFSKVYRRENEIVLE